MKLAISESIMNSDTDMFVSVNYDEEMYDYIYIEQREYKVLMWIFFFNVKDIYPHINFPLQKLESKLVISEINMPKLVKVRIHTFLQTY